MKNTDEYVGPINDLIGTLTIRHLILRKSCYNILDKTLSLYRAYFLETDYKYLFHLIVLIKVSQILGFSVCKT